MPTERTDPLSGVGSLSRETGSMLRGLTTAERGARAARGGAEPVARGKAGVDAFVRDLESAGGRVVTSEPTVYAGGVRTRPDLLVEMPSGEQVFIDVKTGTGRWTMNQKTGYPAIMAEGGRGAGLRAKEGGIDGAFPSFRVWVVHYP